MRVPLFSAIASNFLFLIIYVVQSMKIPWWVFLWKWKA